MSAIKNKNTSPEMVIRKMLHKAGYRYRLNVRTMPGSPDIVLPKYKAVIFVNGCFWHYHRCHLSKLPSVRTDWWLNKLKGTAKRDNQRSAELRGMGWRVLTLWECSIRGKRKLPLEEILHQIAAWLDSDEKGKVIQGTGN